MKINESQNVLLDSDNITAPDQPYPIDWTAHEFGETSMTLLVSGPKSDRNNYLPPPAAECVIFNIQSIYADSAALWSALKRAVGEWLDSSPDGLAIRCSHPRGVRLDEIKDEVAASRSSLQPFFQRHGILDCTLVISHARGIWVDQEIPCWWEQVREVRQFQQLLAAQAELASRTDLKPKSSLSPRKSRKKAGDVGGEHTCEGDTKPYSPPIEQVTSSVG